MATGVENAKATVAMRGTLLAIVMHTMCVAANQLDTTQASSSEERAIDAFAVYQAGGLVYPPRFNYDLTNSSQAPGRCGGQRCQPMHEPPCCRHSGGTTVPGCSASEGECSMRLPASLFKQSTSATGKAMEFPRCFSGDVSGRWNATGGWTQSRVLTERTNALDDHLCNVSGN